MVAAEILRPIPGAGEIAKIVLAHHECPDGSGYPHGLTLGYIPTEAQILSVADVFSALTEDRPYHLGTDSEQALAVVNRLKGRKLAARAVGALVGVLARPGNKN